MFRSKSLPELHDALQRVLAMRDDAVYVTLQLPRQELTIGRNEMPKLPSSRTALIAGATNTRATPYRDAIEKIVPLDMVAMGSAKFGITVDHTLKRK